MLTCPGTHFSKAIFVPSMSTYNKVTSGVSVIPPDIHLRDLSWQLYLQRIWEKLIHGKGDGLCLIASLFFANFASVKEFASSSYCIIIFLNAESTMKKTSPFIYTSFKLAKHTY